MKALWGSKKKPPQLDLAAIRDTLLYIESDLARSPEHIEVLKPIKDALLQLERHSPKNVTAPSLSNVVHFYPANL